MNLKDIIKEKPFSISNSESKSISNFKSNSKSISINPVQKAIVKRELLKGSSKRKALLKASYSKSYAHKSKHPVVDVCLDEIMRDFDASTITVERVLKDFEYGKQLALKNNDLTNYTRICEAHARYLAMFTDKKQVETKDITQTAYSEVLKHRTIKPEEIATWQ